MTLRLVCVVRIFLFQQQKMRKLDLLQGCLAGGHTMHVPGMSVAGICARFVPTIKWHPIAYFVIHILQNNKKSVF